MPYEMMWLGWKAGKVTDAEVITRMHVDPFFQAYFEKKRTEMREAREQAETRH